MKTDRGKGSIRQAHHEDLGLLFAWRNNSEIRRFMFNQECIALDKHQQWFEAALQQQDSCLLIYEIDNVALGCTNFSNAIAGQVSEWGFYTAPDAPKGCGSLMGRLVLDHAFVTLGIDKVCAEVLDYNLASIRMHEKIGFKREGLFRQQHKIDDCYHDVIRYGLLSQEWDN